MSTTVESSRYPFNISELLTFHPKEEIAIGNEKVQYGDVDYENSMFEMLGCVLWKGRYFTLERLMFNKEEGSIFLCEFYERNHNNYGVVDMLTSNSTEKERRDCLIDFVKKHHIKD